MTYTYELPPGSAAVTETELISLARTVVIGQPLPDWFHNPTDLAEYVAALLLKNPSARPVIFGDSVVRVIDLRGGES